MERQKGYYALLQYSPFPERQEFVNVGVLLCVPEERFLKVKFADNQRRIERVFGKQNKDFIQKQQKALENRLYIEVSRYLNVEELEKFARVRANELRISGLKPATVSDAHECLQSLFEELVGDSPRQKRSQPIQSKLKIAFEEAGVISFLEKPAPVTLFDYGVTVSAPFAYQNGHFNMIDPMRLDEDPDHALKEVGKRAFEGGWLAKAEHDKRLVVVGDFSRHSVKFYDAVHDVMRENQVRLYRLDELKPLIRDIEKSAHDHGLRG